MWKQFLIAKAKRSINDAFLFTKTKVKVKVNQGVINGCVETLPNGNKYNRYSAIPYAKIPTGSLRFKAPQKLLKFDTDEIDCTREGDACYQKSTLTRKFIGSENCLHLNVYTPADYDSSSKKAVMVFIHGGGFMLDSNSVDFYSPEYLLMQEVIVVTINYRLHALGFISIPSLEINGNAGLKDQQMALEWVHENISSFNGDPDKICLFGESAGGTSVHLQVLNQKSRNFINSAIAQSGCALTNWGYQKDAEEKTRRLARKLGAVGKSDHDVLDALMKAPLDKVFMTIRDIQDPDDVRRNLPFVFKPCVERGSIDAFMTENSLDLIRMQEDKISLPMMFGCNSLDGSTVSIYNRKNLKSYRDDPVKMIPQTVNIDPMSEEAQELGKRISYLYFGKDGPTHDNFDKFIDLNTDFYFTVSQMMCRNLNIKYQKNMKQFFYHFDYDGELSFLKRALKIENIKGAAHFDELSYLFRHQIIDVNVSEDSTEHKMREMMVKLWTNFAKYNNPTPEGDKSLNFQWDCDKRKETMNYLLLQENPKMIDNIKFKRIKFWKNVYEQYNRGFDDPKFL